jgi:hypothetical protein
MASHARLSPYRLLEPPDRRGEPGRRRSLHPRSARCRVASARSFSMASTFENSRRMERAVRGFERKSAFLKQGRGRVRLACRRPSRSGEGLSNLPARLCRSALLARRCAFVDRGRRPGGPDRGVAANLRSELELRDSVRWLGLRRDMPALLDAADAFVSGSAWEGMPLAVGEAMAMEKPVVATDVGGVRELVGDAGLVVPAKDSGALADAMQATMGEGREASLPRPRRTPAHRRSLQHGRDREHMACALRIVARRSERP